MKTIFLALILTISSTSSLYAFKLSEFLSVRPVGKFVGKAKASNLVPEHLVGKLFAVSSEKSKVWQVRFFTFEDRNAELGKKNTFGELVKKFGLDDLQSQGDIVPYNDGTFQSFTYKDANDLLKSKGKPPLPEGVYFVIAFREVVDPKSTLTGGSSSRP